MATGTLVAIKEKLKISTNKNIASAPSNGGISFICATLRRIFDSVQVHLLQWLVENDAQFTEMNARIVM